MATVTKSRKRKVDATLTRRASALKRLSDQAHALASAFALATAGDQRDPVERIAARLDGIRKDLVALAVETQHDATGPAPEVFPLFDPRPEPVRPSPVPERVEAVEAPELVEEAPPARAKADRRVKAPAPYVAPLTPVQWVAYRLEDGLPLFGVAAIPGADPMRTLSHWGNPPLVSEDWTALIAFREATPEDLAANLPDPGEFAWDRFFGPDPMFPAGADPTTFPGRVEDQVELDPAPAVEPAPEVEPETPTPALAAPRQDEPRGARKRPRPAEVVEPAPGAKLPKGAGWVVKVGSDVAFRVYRPSRAEAEAQLWEKGIDPSTVTLEYVPKTSRYNRARILSDVAREDVGGVLDYLRQCAARDRSDAALGVYAVSPKMAREMAGIPDPAPATDQQLENGLPAPEVLDQVEAVEASPAPSWPTATPDDPMSAVDIAVLGLRGDLVAQLKAVGIEDVSTLSSALYSELVGRCKLRKGERERIAEAIDKRERRRAGELVESGEWIAEEITYHALRKPEAVATWERLRREGATDGQVRDAINKSFYQGGAGFDVAYRVGSWFERHDQAPALYQGASRPARGVEPTLEGKHLIAAVRRVLAIPGPRNGGDQ